MAKTVLDMLFGKETLEHIDSEIDRIKKRMARRKAQHKKRMDVIENNIHRINVRASKKKAEHKKRMQAIEARTAELKAANKQRAKISREELNPALKRMDQATQKGDIKEATRIFKEEVLPALKKCNGEPAKPAAKPTAKPYRALSFLTPPKK